MSKVIAAAVQFNSVHKDVEGNRSRIVAFTREAAKCGAKLIVFPEMATSGYVWADREEVTPYVEPIPGPTTSEIALVAKEADCYVVIGMPEIDLTNGAFYNSAVLIGPEGVVGTYRKTHLFAADPRWAREGNDGYPVFDTNIGKIGMLICMDAMYFEPARILRLQDADIIAFPTNWVGNGNNAPSKTWCLRAKENGVSWVAANRSDSELGAQFTGGSSIIGPDGESRQFLVSGEGIVYGELKSSDDTKSSLKRTRKPEAYQEILLHPYLWREGETYALHAEQAPFDIAVLPIEEMQLLGKQIERHLSSMVLKDGIHRLIVIPERRIATGETDGYLQELTDVARVNKVYIAAAADAACYVLGPDGNVIGYSRQIHETVGDDPGRYSVFQVPFGRVGVLTGVDAKYPESYRVLAKYGADIIAVSGSGTEENEVWMQRIWAFENDAILACAQPSSVPSSVLFLHRQVTMESDDGTPIVNTFYPESMATARSRPFMRRMKTHLYDRIVQKG